MCYYQFKRHEILQKVKEKYYKKKMLNIISKKKNAIKEKSKHRYKNLSEEEK